jgi:hypothetical protein
MLVVVFGAEWVAVMMQLVMRVAPWTLFVGAVVFGSHSGRNFRKGIDVMMVL